MIFAFIKECFDSGVLLSNVYDRCFYQQSDVFHFSKSKTRVEIRRSCKFWCPVCQQISWFLKFISLASGLSASIKNLLLIYSDAVKVTPKF